MSWLNRESIKNVLYSIVFAAGLYVLLISSIYLYSFFDYPPVSMYAKFCAPFLLPFAVAAFFIVKAERSALRWRTQIKIMVAFLVLWLLSPILYCLFFGSGRNILSAILNVFQNLLLIFLQPGMIFAVYYPAFLYLLAATAISIFIAYVAYFAMSVSMSSHTPVSPLFSA